jgi:hypothetical protein
VQQAAGIIGGGALLDDDERFADLPTLQLTTLSGERFALPDVRRMTDVGAPSAILRPADCAGPALSPAQIANQVRLSLDAIAAASSSLRNLLVTDVLRRCFAVGTTQEVQCMDTLRNGNHASCVLCRPCSPLDA